jgi:hypothetical protein
LKNKSLISILLLVVAALISAFLFIADYWEPFQGDLQDPIFYLSFILPGLFFAFAILNFLPEPKKKNGSLAFMASLTAVWAVIYIICLKLFGDRLISSNDLQYLLILFGTAGGMLAVLLGGLFFPIQSPRLLYEAGAICLVLVCISQFGIVPALQNLFEIQLNDLQSAGVVVFFWQLSLGLLIRTRLSN